MDLQIVVFFILANALNLCRINSLGYILDARECCCRRLNSIWFFIKSRKTQKLICSFVACVISWFIVAVSNLFDHIAVKSECGKFTFRSELGTKMPKSSRMDRPVSRRSIRFLLGTTIHRWSWQQNHWPHQNTRQTGWHSTTIRMG